MRAAIVAVALTIGGLDMAVPVSEASAALLDARSKTRKEFHGLWDSRLKQYMATQSRLAAEHKAATDAVLTPLFAFADGDNRLAVFADASLADGEVSGRGMLLEEFLVHFAKKPSVGLTRAWLQGQFDKVRETAAEANRLEKEVLALFKRSDTTMLDLIPALEEAELKRGEAVGRTKELILLVDNFSAYATEFEMANARDVDARRRLGAALAAFGAGLQANRGWVATCNRTGPTVTCAGR